MKYYRRTKFMMKKLSEMRQLSVAEQVLNEDN